MELCLLPFKRLTLLARCKSPKPAVHHGPAVLLFQLPVAAHWSSRELQWLVSTCWNRGCHHIAFERPDQAVPFLKIALRLLDSCLELQHRKVRCPSLFIEGTGTRERTLYWTDR